MYFFMAEDKETERLRKAGFQEYILNRDVENIEKEYKNCCDINKKITLSEFITETPLEIAIQCIKEEVILWLIEKGVNIKADVDDWGTPISSVARFLSSEMCELFIKHGALANLTKKQYKRIYTDIYYGENYGLFFKSQPDVGTTARIVIPTRNVS